MDRIDFIIEIRNILCIGCVENPNTNKMGTCKKTYEDLIGCIQEEHSVYLHRED